MAGEGDAVSVMQESLDQLALSMFDSLRLIPFSEEVQGGARGVAPQQQGAPGALPLRRAVATNAAWASQVQSLAEGVLKQAKQLDGLIDELPGADLREDQQMEVRCVVFTAASFWHPPHATAFISGFYDARRTWPCAEKKRPCTSSPAACFCVARVLWSFVSPSLGDGHDSLAAYLPDSDPKKSTSTTVVLDDPPPPLPPRATPRKTYS